jgi:hypothetical protein
VILDRISRWREQHNGWWEVGITIDLKTRWKIVDYALKCRKSEIRKHDSMLPRSLGAAELALGAKLAWFLVLVFVYCVGCRA